MGVTSNLSKRILEHRTKLYPDSFTAKYNCVELVFYKFFDRIEEAILEEKRIKGGNRTQKERLIDEFNIAWKDLSDSLESQSSFSHVSVRLLPSSQ